MLRRILKVLVLTLLMLSFMGQYDVVHLNPAQRVSLAHRYSLAGWELGNLASKWVHLLTSSLSGRTERERRSDVREYFRLRGEMDLAASQLRAAAARPGADQNVAALEVELEKLRSARERLRDDVEEVLESAVSSIAVRIGIASWGELVFPPVDIRLTEPPIVLVTSPRGRIDRAFEALLAPDVQIGESEAMERRLAEEWDLSGWTGQVGGVATYPASVLDGLPLRETLQAIAHEWLHHYLVFRPLGRHLFSSPEMQALNETFANMAGNEIGDQALQDLGQADGQNSTPNPDTNKQSDASGSNGSGRDAGEFDFRREMRETRLAVDGLLKESNVEEAEAYMEQRRRTFVANGHNIRKINQAYFAFHGTYADSPQSSNPIGAQMQRLRAQTADLETFVKTMSDISSYEQFLVILRGLGVRSSPALGES